MKYFSKFYIFILIIVSISVCSCLSEIVECEIISPGDNNVFIFSSGRKPEKYTVNNRIRIKIKANGSDSIGVGAIKVNEPEKTIIRFTQKSGKTDYINLPKKGRTLISWVFVYRLDLNKIVKFLPSKF